MSDLSYVRKEMLPEQAPPVSEAGIVGWMHANLFSGWLNSSMSILVVVLLYFSIAPIVPWLMHGVWNAGSLNECRKIIVASYGQGADGACWAVIHDRLLQFTFGFYPSDQYWRPTLAFLLLFPAIAPVLFSRVPRKMLLFSAVYPFLVAWLMWGGSAWGAIDAFLGFVIGVVLYRMMAERFGALLSIIISVLATILWWLFLSGPVAGILHGIIPLSLEPVESRKFGGFMLSILLGTTGIAASFPLGIVLALGRQSDLLIVKSLSVGFIEFIRGVPLITLLFVANSLLNIFLPPGTDLTSSCG